MCSHSESYCDKLAETGWLFDERAHAGPEHLDPAYVAGYDRKAGTDPADDVADLADHGLTAGSTVIDLGAGTGTFAVAAAPHCRRVVAVDVSAPMLDVLRRRAERAGAGNVECVPAGFLSYEHEGPAADVVYTRNALHHLPDFWKGIALHRLAGILRPGGTLLLRDLIYDFGPSEAGAVIGAWLAGAATDPALGFTADDLAEHVGTEHSTYRWLLEPMLTAAAFEIVSVEYAKHVFGRYRCVKA